MQTIAAPFDTQDRIPNTSMAPVTKRIGISFGRISEFTACQVSRYGPTRIIVVLHR